MTLSGLAEGSVLVDHTTGSAQLARQLAADAGRRGVGFLDAPVSGGQSGAENGALTIMVGGDETDFERALPVLDCLGDQIHHVGPTGSGNIVKLLNQMIFLHYQLLFHS